MTDPRPGARAARPRTRPRLSGAGATDPVAGPLATAQPNSPARR